ncbi:hypothetical protein UPYG_G00191130 [Umbra pygmaea]|uniref:trypsin n=1 Tax=Umbra pygmaea TaxID=75934 RepID=A0ABD0XBE4_UMBPY
MMFRALTLWVVTILTLYQHKGDCAKIIGGKEVKPHSLPYMALLVNKNGLLCGGILIQKQWVLTAAHCNEIMAVFLGVHNSTQVKLQNIKKVKVKKIFAHPNYINTTKGDDIMLVQLNGPVDLSNKINFIQIPKPVDDIPAGTVCFVAGWGLTNEKDKNSDSDVLLSVNVTVIDRETCNSSDYYNKDPVIRNEMLCAGYVNDVPADSCMGDSGGPLVCEGLLRGVVSFGRGCGDKKYPGVYTFISKYDNWIKENIRTSV